MLQIQGIGLDILRYAGIALAVGHEGAIAPLEDFDAFGFKGLDDPILEHLFVLSDQFERLIERDIMRIDILERHEVAGTVANIRAKATDIGLDRLALGRLTEIAR